MDDVPKDEFEENGCYNCKWGKDWTDPLHNPDGTKMDSVVGEIICQKDQQRHNVGYSCDIWEPHPEESQQSNP